MAVFGKKMEGDTAEIPRIFQNFLPSNRNSIPETTSGLMGADYNPASAVALINEGATEVSQGLMDLEYFYALQP